MVAMAIDGPVGEDDVGGFGVEDTGEGVVMSGIDGGAAVVLAGERRPGVEDAASTLGFGGANSGTAVEIGAATVTFAAIQVEQHHFVAACGIARDGSSAATFGVSRMASRHHDLEFGRDGQGGEQGAT